MQKLLIFQIEEHQQHECQQQEIPCTYSDIGCDVKVSLFSVNRPAQVAADQFVKKFMYNSTIVTKVLQFILMN